MGVLLQLLEIVPTLLKCHLRGGIALRVCQHPTFMICNFVE